VIHASPLLDKLHVYRGLGVPEIWLFEESAFKLYRLGESGYESVERSGFLPDLDFTLIADLAVREDQHEALRELRTRLGSR
jgi:Uma2 family endonuclease